jgi:2-haloacid dehalogenase
MDTKITTIIFDLGGVLIDWNPRYVYRQIFDNEEKIDWFFENICTHEWNEHQDAGRSLQEATEELVAKFPEYENEVRAYYGRWEEMLGGPVNETVEILHLLKQLNKYNLYALTNWSAETFPVALERYDFLKWFDGIVMSGEEKTRKPFPEIYQTLLNRFNVNASEVVFIDDSLRNIKGAEDVGIDGIHFQSPQQLSQELKQRGLMVAK